MKNWMTTIPETDAEAEEFLRYGKERLMGDSLCGLFRVRRAQGDSILDACEKALRAVVEATPS